MARLLTFKSINNVTLKTSNDNYEVKYISDFVEYDSEIVFETPIQIDGLNRGWTGDLFYHISDGYDVESGESVDNIKYATYFHDVLLARVTVSASPGYGVIWKYTFLKD